MKKNLVVSPEKLADFAALWTFGKHQAEISRWLDRCARSWATCQKEMIQLLHEVEQLRVVVEQKNHYIVFSDNGWSVEHLLGCRPNMTACRYHTLAQKDFGMSDPGLRGRFKATILGDGELFLEKAGEES